MGKASRWLRNLLFLPGWKGRKAKDRGAADADCQSVLSALLPSHSQAATAAPSGREKRRWSFRRPGASSGGAQGQGPLASSSSQCFSEAEVHVVVAQEQDKDQQQQFVAAAAVVVVPESASSAASTVVPLPASGRRSAGGRDAEAAAAAVRIQAAFRSYLARKALCALRGMVKLQAMVRGQLVRRQANLTLCRMQALVHAQRRARAERLRLLEADDGASSRHQATATPRPPLSRRSPQHLRSRKAPEATEKSSEENDVRIVEVDDGAPRAGARRNSSYCHYATSTTTPSRTPAKAELLLCQTKVSPSQTPSSARTDASARTLSGRFDVDDASFASASEPTPTPVPVPSRRRAWRADLPAFPSYMANTESSRAKQARSQSAPRQRLSSASDTTVAASPSPSCWERPPSRGGGGGSARRRSSFDPLDLPGGGGAPSRRMERCASRARASTMSSVPSSECGSSSTVGHRGSARAGHSHGMGPWVTTDSSRSQCTVACVWRSEEPDGSEEYGILDHGVF